MKQIDDQELDMLIGQALEREAMLDEMAAVVMADIRQTSHRARWHRWARMVGFAFGLPLVIVSYGLGLHYVYTNVAMQPAIAAGLAVSAATMLLFAVQAVKIFSPDSV